MCRQSASTLLRPEPEDSSSEHRFAWVIGGEPGDITSTCALVLDLSAQCPEEIAADAKWLILNNGRWVEGILTFRAAPPPPAECVICLDTKATYDGRAGRAARSSASATAAEKLATRRGSRCTRAAPMMLRRRH